MFSKLWIVRICMAVSVLVMLILSTRVYWWWMRRLHQTLSIHWELICLYVLLYAISGLLLGLHAEVFLNFRKVRFNPFSFIILGIIPIALLVLWMGGWAGYWSPSSLPVFADPLFINYFSSPFTSIWLGIAVGKAFYIREPTHVDNT